MGCHSRVSSARRAAGFLPAADCPTTPPSVDTAAAYGPRCSADSLACGRMDATWYVRVTRVRTEDNRWRRPVSSPDRRFAQRETTQPARPRAGPSSRSPVPHPASARCSPSGWPRPRRSSRSSPSTSGAARCAEAQWHILDVRDPAIAEKLRGADVVVHLALDLDLETDPAARTAYNVRGTQTVLTAAAAAGVHRVVLCTSAMVYGALPDNDVPLAEDAELRATAEATGVGDLLEIERLGRRAPRAHPGLNVTVVRPAVLVGGTDTALTRYFESPRLLVVAGSRPAWQFCHVEDLVQRPGVRRRWRRSTASWRSAATAGWSRRRSRSSAASAAWSCPRRSPWAPRPGCTGSASRPSPAGDLAYTMHPWVVSGSRLHDAGWRPQWTNEEVLAELLEEVAGPPHASPGRRLGRKDATAAGAAGATVALLGTAALVRRARKARRRLRPAVRDRTGRRSVGRLQARSRRRAGRIALFRDVGAAYGTMEAMASTHDHPGEQAAQDPIRLLGDPRHPALRRRGLRGRRRRRGRRHRALRRHRAQPRRRRRRRRARVLLPSHGRGRDAPGRGEGRRRLPGAGAGRRPPGGRPGGRAIWRSSSPCPARTAARPSRPAAG